MRSSTIPQMAAAQVPGGPAFGDRNTSAQCDQAPSRRWLRHKYLRDQLLGTEILQLNAIKRRPADGCGTSTWGTSFWGQKYFSWMRSSTLPQMAAAQVSRMD